MRKWHRWLVVFTGVFLVWIAATGLVGQVVSLAGGEHHEGPPPGANAGRPKLPTAAADDGDRNGPPVNTAVRPTCTMSSSICTRGPISDLSAKVFPRCWVRRCCSFPSPACGCTSTCFANAGAADGQVCSGNKTCQGIARRGLRQCVQGLSAWARCHARADLPRADRAARARHRAGPDAMSAAPSPRITEYPLVSSDGAKPVHLQHVRQTPHGHPCLIRRDHAGRSMISANFP